MNLNKVYIVGRMAADPEFRTTPNGNEVVTLRVVTNRIYNDRSGQRQEVPEFHTVVAWGRLAQISQQYLNKGGLVMIEGRLQTRSWEGQDGIKRYRTEVIANNVQLGPKSANPNTTAKTTSFHTSNQSPQNNNDTKSDDNENNGVKDEEIPVVNEDEPTTSSDDSHDSEKPESSDVEESKVDMKDIPF